MRLLRASSPVRRENARPSRRAYGEAVRLALVMLWEASDRICGKRLRPLVPILVESTERHGHLALAPEVRSGLPAMSAATIDRAVKNARGQTGTRPRRRPPPSSAIRRSVAVLTFDVRWPPSAGQESERLKRESRRVQLPRPIRGIL